MSGPSAPEPPAAESPAQQRADAASRAPLPAAGPVALLGARVSLALATLASVLAIVAIWADRQLLNPNNWANTSTQLLQRSSVRSAVSGFLVDELYSHVDVSAQIGKGLPHDLRPLSGPISGALHSAAETAAADLLAQPRVQNAWRQANYAADQQLIHAVVNGEPGLRLEEESVTLDLRAIVTALARRLGVPESVIAKLPPSVADVKVLKWSDAGLVRDIARALRPLALTMIALAVLLYALAFGLARGRRRRTLVTIGVSLVLSGLIVLALRKIVQPHLIDAITKDASIQQAANEAYSVATSLLVQAAVSPVVIGLAFILAAWLAGPASWALATRRFLAPRVRLHPAAAYAIAVGLLALIFAWGPIPATRNLIEMVMFTILALLGAHVLRRQMAIEFPDAAPVSLRAALRRQLHEMLAAIAQALPGASERASDSVAGELERLVALRERDAITPEEFTLAKRQLLGSG